MGMLNTGNYLGEAYFNALNGNITLNAVNVPVFDRVTNTQEYPYIHLSTQTQSDTSNKQTFTSDTTMLIDIVTAFDNGFGGKKDSDTIAEQVLDIVRTMVSDGYIAVDSQIKIVTATLDDSYNIESQNATHTIYRKLLRIRNKVEQI